MDTPFSTPRYLRTLAFGLILFLSILFSLNPFLRKWTREAVLPPYRKVLSTASAFLIDTQRLQKVVKIKTRDGLFLEIYSPTENGQPNLLQTIELNDSLDGYFYIKNAATNLALFDINNDRKIEIVAPTFDANLSPHLNVFTYDSKIQRFIPVTGEL